MAYTRRTGDTFGVYAKVKNEAGKWTEVCLCRLGPHETPQAAARAYAAELRHERAIVKRLRYSTPLIDRRERVRAEWAIRRLRPKLAAVRAYLRQQQQQQQASEQQPQT
jgi:hypothetical protein